MADLEGIDVGSESATAMFMQMNIDRMSIRDSRVELDGIVMNGEIRTKRIDDLSSIVSAYPSVRQILIGLQRAQVTAKGLIAEGRDMGSVVFPDAQLKVYLTAPLEVRARRRWLQRQAQGKPDTLEEITDLLRIRDHRDKIRKDSPLCVPEGALYIDSKDLTIDQVVDRISEAWEKLLVAA